MIILTINRKYLLKSIAILLVILFTFSNSLFAYSGTDNLSPWLSFSSGPESSELKPETSEALHPEDITAEAEPSSVNYEDLVKDQERLSGVDSFMCDFDGVDRVEFVGEGGYVRVAMPEDVVIARRALSRRGVLNVTVTANIPKFFEQKFGGLKRMASLSVKTPFHILTRSGAFGQYMESNGDIKNIPGYEQRSFKDNNTAGEIFNIAVEKLIEVMTEKGIVSPGDKVKIIMNPSENLFSIYAGDKLIIEWIRYGITPMGVTINVIKDARLHDERFRLARMIREDRRIKEMIEEGGIPDTAEFVASFSAIDIMPVSKGASVIQMIKNKRLKRIVLMADSAGTEENPGNDRSMLVLNSSDLRSAGIDWEVDLIKVYVGNESNMELPPDVYIMPEHRRGIAPSVDMYNAVVNAKDKNIRREKEERYRNLISGYSGSDRLAGVEAFFSDFDGVDRVTVIGGSDGLQRKELPEEVVEAKRALADEGVLNVTMTGTTLQGLLAKSGSLEKVAGQSSDGTYYHMLLCSGSMGKFVDGSGNVEDIPGYKRIEFAGEGTVDEIFSVMTEHLLELLKNSTAYKPDVDHESLRIVHSDDGEFIWIYAGGKKISDPIRVRVLPNSVSIGMVDDPDVYLFKTQLIRMVKDDPRIISMIREGYIPETAEFVASFSAVDVVPVSKGESLLQMVKMKKLKRIVIMADAIGTEDDPGNDRSMMTLGKEDLERAGIDWDVDMIKIYAGKEENIDLPDDVYIIPPDEKEIAPGLSMYNTVLAAKEAEAEKDLLKDKARVLSDDIKSGKLEKVAALREEYIIESPFNGGRSITVYKDPEKDEKIAYIDPDNWGTAVLVPAESGISIYTDHAGPCVPLIMRLVDADGVPYILAAHLLHGKVGQETENIIRVLKEKGFSPESIVLNPRNTSVYQYAKKLLQIFLDASEAEARDPEVMTVIDDRRVDSQVSGARAFTDNRGWGLYTEGFPPGTSGVWNRLDNAHAVEPEDILVYFSGEEYGYSPPQLKNKTSYDPNDRIYLSRFAERVFAMESGFIHSYFRLFNTFTGEVLKTFDMSHSDGGLSYDGTKILTVDRITGTVDISDILTGEKSRMALPDMMGEWEVRLSPDKSILIANGVKSEKVFILDVSTGRTVGEIEMEDPVTSTAIGPGNDMILVTTENKEAFFDIEGNLIISHDRPSMEIKYTDFSYDGKKYLTANEQKIIIRDVETGAKTGYALSSGENIKAAVFAEESDHVLIADEKGIIRKLEIIPARDNDNMAPGSADGTSLLEDIEEKTRKTTELIMYNNIQRVGHIAEEYVLRDPSDTDGNHINVYDYEKASLPGKVAYIDDDNWGTGLLLPDDIDTGIFTDSAGACIPVLMRLRGDDGEFYIFLAHVKKEEERKEVENIVRVLTGYAFVPEQIIIYPAEEGNTSSVTRTLLQRFMDDSHAEEDRRKVEAYMDISRIARKEKGARAYVDKDGWGIYNPMEDHGEFNLWNDRIPESDSPGAESDGADEELDRFKQASSFRFLMHLIGRSLYLDISESGVYDLLDMFSPHIDMPGFELADVRKKDSSIFIVFRDLEAEEDILLRFYFSSGTVDEAEGTEIYINGNRICCDTVKVETSPMKDVPDNSDTLLSEHQVQGDRKALMYLNTGEFKEILSGENRGLIDDLISENHEIIRDTRSFVKELPSPIEIDGQLFDRVQVKGVVFDENQPFETRKSGDPGYVDTPIRTDKYGRVFTDFPNPKPAGGMHYEDSRNAFLQHYLMYHSKTLRENGIYVSAPLGFGYFPDASRHRGKLVGFVITGMHSAMPDRNLHVSEDITHVARTLRELHTGGFSHPYLHLGNFNGDINNTFVFDLDGAEFLPLTDTGRRKMLSAYMRDILYFYMQFLYIRLNVNTKLQGSGLPLLFEETGQAYLKVFVDIYFESLSGEKKSKITSAMKKSFYDIVEKFTNTGDISISYDTASPDIKFLFSAIDEQILGRRERIAEDDNAVKMFHDMVRMIAEKENGLNPKDRMKPDETVSDSKPFQYEEDIAVSFTDHLKLMRFDQNRRDNSLVIGIDISWIPEDQRSFIQPLLASLQRLSTKGSFPGLRIIVGNGESLAEDIIRETRDISFSRAIILGDYATIYSDEFMELKDTVLKDKYTFIAVEPVELSPTSDVRILEMLTTAIKMGYGSTSQLQKRSLLIEQDKQDSNIFYFQPVYGEYDIEELKTIYRIQSSILKAA